MGSYVKKGEKKEPVPACQKRLLVLYHKDCGNETQTFCIYHDEEEADSERPLQRKDGNFEVGRLWVQDKTKYTRWVT